MRIARTAAVWWFRLLGAAVIGAGLFGVGLAVWRLIATRGEWWPRYWWVFVVVLGALITGAASFVLDLDKVLKVAPVDVAGERRRPRLVRRQVGRKNDAL